MESVNEFFKRYKINSNKLENFGFTKNDGLFQISKLIVDNQFKLEVIVDEKEEVLIRLIEVEFNEEYPLARLNNRGLFTSQIRLEIEDYLLEIRNTCFTENLFLSEQTNRINKLICEKYNVKPEFPWEGENYAVFRNKDTNKWFSLIMNINQNKLDKEINREVEIINIKLSPDKIVDLISQNGFYKAYHMNKKYWITILLDDIIDDKIIMELIDESYQYSIKK